MKKIIIAFLLSLPIECMLLATTGQSITHERAIENATGYHGTLDTYDIDSYLEESPALLPTPLPTWRLWLNKMVNAIIINYFRFKEWFAARAAAVKAYFAHNNTN